MNVAEAFYGTFFYADIVKNAIFVVISFLVYQAASIFFIFLRRCSLARAIVTLRFLDHTQRSTRFGRSPLDEWSARRI